MGSKSSKVQNKQKREIILPEKDKRNYGSDGGSGGVGVVNKLPNDKNYSYHHNTVEGRKILGNLTDEMGYDCD